MPFATEFAQARFQSRLTQEQTASYLTGKGIRTSKRSVEAWEAGDSTPSTPKQEAVLNALRQVANGRDSTVAAQVAEPAEIRAGYRSLQPDIDRRRAELEAERIARDVGLAQEYERPYAVIAGAKVPLPFRDVDLDEETGRPLIGYVTIPVALGPPRFAFAPAGGSSAERREEQGHV